MTTFTANELTGLTATALSLSPVKGAGAYSIVGNRSIAGGGGWLDLRPDGAVKWPLAGAIGEPQTPYVQIGSASNLGKLLAVQGWVIDSRGRASDAFPDGIPKYKRAVRRYVLSGPSLEFELSGTDFVFIEQATLCPIAGVTNATVVEGQPMHVGFLNEIPGPGVPAGASHVIIPVGGTWSGSGAVIVPPGMRAAIIGARLVTDGNTCAMRLIATTRDDPGDSATDRDAAPAIMTVVSDGAFHRLPAPLPVTQSARLRLQVSGVSAAELAGVLQIAVFARGSMESGCVPGFSEIDLT